MNQDVGVFENAFHGFRIRHEVRRQITTVELEPFDKATVSAARAAAARARAGKLVAVAGGGDTVAALHHAGAAQDFTFVSTAGGAFLEWMEGKELPGVQALTASGSALT